MRRPAQPPAPAPTRRPRHGVEAWTGLLAATAVLKIVGCLALTATQRTGIGVTPFPEIVPLAHIVVFGGAGFVLATGGRDRRGIHLGIFFLLVAVSFANGMAFRLEDVPPTAQRVRQVLLALHPDAFLPLFLWLFVTQFPRLHRFDRGQRLEQTFVGVATAAGVALLLASALAGSVRGSMLPAVGALGWEPAGSWFDTILFGLAIPALPFGLWKAGRADVRERRRYSLFVTGLAVGFLPLAAEVFAEAMSPAYMAFMDVPPRRLIVGLLLYPLLLSIPVTTAYAVLVHRVMNVKLLVRTAVQYALARYTIVGLAVASAAWLPVSLVRNRHLTIGALFTTSEAASTVAPLALLLIVLATRRALLERIDRIFFREVVDTRTLLGALAMATESRGDSVETVCRVFSDRVQATLHLAQSDVLLADAEAGWLSSATRRLRPLALDSALASALAVRPEPIVLELDAPGGWARDLPVDEQQWLADADVHLLIPLRSDDSWVGMMALGEKLNGLPFSREDQSLLADVAAALVLNLENLRLRQPDPGAWLTAHRQEPRTADNEALVCETCGLIAASIAERCARCGGSLTLAQLPALLAGKFRLERELGRGGMGVVYLAFDTTLERPVAIKTLPRVSVAASVRQRREARAMAGFTHPHLALIFGLESWRGAPALVMEYLEGGTLAKRLRRSRLSPLEVAHLARDLAGAIALIHDAGLLHRDIKPSNIAFTGAGEPKLLDFGLAQLVSAGRLWHGRATLDPAAWAAGADLTTVDSVGRFAGTPAYMAPEAVGGDSLDAAADLWSLGVVLFECLTGELPFKGLVRDTPDADWARRMSRSRARLTASNSRSPSSSVASFPRSCLRSDRGKRPAAPPRLD